MKAERILIDDLVAMTGKSRRALQDMALRGQIPGAGKIGREWTFDRRKVRRWINAAENDSCRTTSSSAAMSGGSRFRWPESSIDVAYEQALGL